MARFFQSPIRSVERTHMLFRTPVVSPDVRFALAEGLGTFRRPTARTAGALREIGYYGLSEEVTRQMWDAQPKRVDPVEWAYIRAFVTDSVATTLPETTHAARLLTSTAGIYVAWVVYERGYPLKAGVVWQRDLIDEWIQEGATHLSDGTRRNYRNYLSRIAEAVAVDPSQLSFTPIRRKNTAVPYTPAEMLMFRNWATGQSTPLKVRHGMLMLTLCAGAGLSSSEVARVHPEHVHVSDAGIMIDVRGTQPRLVPLLAEWDDWMMAFLRQKPPAGKPLWGAIARKDQSHVLSSFVRTTIGAGPQASRLRNTWLITLLNARAPMREVFLAAGVRKLEALGFLLDYVTPVPAGEYLPALRGEATR